MNRQIKGITITVLFLSQIFLLMPSITVWAAIDGSELAARGIEINANLQEKLFRGSVIGGIKGLGEEGGNKIDGNTHAYPLQNAIGYASFLSRYSRSGVNEMDDWAKECLTRLNTLEAADLMEREEEEDVYYTIDQGALLEFVSEGYKISRDQTARILMEKVYNKIFFLESNPESVNPKGYSGAYWEAIDKEGEVYKSRCHANASLWALIGILNFAITLKGQSWDLENQYFENSVTRALEIITFLEKECYFDGAGFKEFPYSEMANPRDHNYYLNTQILAVLAYTRLYQATEEQFYLDKANMMVEYIITKNFLETGNSTGLVSWLSDSTGLKSNTKLSYDHALYAYALIKLYEAGGERDIANLRRAELILNHMHENLYVESADGQVLGYAEYLVNDKIPSAALQGDHLLYTSNALMMLANEDMFWHQRPWYQKYLLYIIIAAIVVLALIFVIILVRKRRRVGTKIPKMVSGLIDEDT